MPKCVFFCCSAGKITFSVAKIQIKFAVFLIIRYLCGQNMRVFCAAAHRPGMKTGKDILGLLLYAASCF